MLCRMFSLNYEKQTQPRKPNPQQHTPHKNALLSSQSFFLVDLQIKILLEIVSFI